MRDGVRIFPNTEVTEEEGMKKETEYGGREMMGWRANSGSALVGLAAGSVRVSIGGKYSDKRCPGEDRVASEEFLSLSCIT